MFAITAEDIKTGRKHSCRACPAALAIGRRLRPGFTVTVSYNEVQVFEHLAAYVAARCPTPVEVRRFAREFDAGLDVGPLRFELPGLSPWFIVR